MSDIRYNTVLSGEYGLVARLHSLSWKENYRGIYSDEYLENEVDEERLEYWKAKFSFKDDNRNILGVYDRGELVGFACTYVFYENKKEHYLDNLHVKSDYRGQGLGYQLLLKSAEWAYSVDNQVPFYLLVYQQNKGAIRFYKRHGAIITGPTPHLNYDGSTSPIMKCTWSGLPLA